MVSKIFVPPVLMEVLLFLEKLLLFIQIKKATQSEQLFYFAVTIPSNRETRDLMILIFQSHQSSADRTYGFAVALKTFLV